MRLILSLLTGDIVGLYDTSECTAAAQIGTGIVTRVSQSAVSVAFDDSKDGASFDDDALYNLLKLANDVTYKRMKRWVALNLGITITNASDVLDLELSCSHCVLCLQGPRCTQWIHKWSSRQSHKCSVWRHKTILPVTAK